MNCAAIHERDVKATVTLRASISCPKCKREIGVSADLDGEAVYTGNTTQTARYWLDDLKRQIVARARAQGWDPTMCGRCRDPVGADEVPIGKAPQDHGGDHECG